MMLYRLMTKYDTLQYRKIMYQFKMLMHHSNPQRVGIIGVIDRHRFPVHLDHSLLRLVQPEQHTHQSGLSCAVLSQQRVYLTFFQPQRNIIICLETAELLSDMFHFNHILLHLKTSSAVFQPLPSSPRET